MVSLSSFADIQDPIAQLTMLTKTYNKLRSTQKKNSMELGLVVLLKSLTSPANDSLPSPLVGILEDNCTLLGT